MLQQFFKGCKIHRSLDLRAATATIRKARLGKGTVIERDCTIWLASEQGGNPTLSIGPDVFIGRNTYIGVFQPVSIGPNTIVGAYSYIISGDHVITDLETPIRDQGYIGEAIEIGEDVWLGCHVVILKGVSIGKGAVVAAGAVVTADIPTYEIWGGVPAKKIASRNGDSVT